MRREVGVALVILGGIVRTVVVPISLRVAYGRHVIGGIGVLGDAERIIVICRRRAGLTGEQTGKAIAKNTERIADHTGKARLGGSLQVDRRGHG